MYSPCFSNFRHRHSYIFHHSKENVLYTLLVMCVCLMLTERTVLLFIMKCSKITRKYVVGILLTITIVQILIGWCAYNSENPNNSAHVGQQIIQWVSSSQNICVTNCTCPTVHIAMVLSGHNEIWNVYLALKSILMHRSTKLHFHFITDNRTKTVLKAMLSSWLVPGITHDYYALYNATEIIKRKFADSPTTYTTCFGALSIKLNLHLVLPDSVRHVIVVEPTSVVNADLFDLWSVTMLHGVAADHMITLCSKYCVSYCYKNTTVFRKDDDLQWGAMGIDLDGIRSSAKAKWWTRTVKSVYLCVPNAVKDVYKVTKILVFNENSDIQEKTNICKLAHEYDGNLLRYKEVKWCTKQLKPMVQVPPNATEYCKLFAWERATLRRELPFILGHSYNASDKYDVTLVNHVNYDRVSLIERSLTNWDGPVSIAIQVTELQAQEVIDMILNSTILKKRKNITYHLMFIIGPSYPINALRSLAHRYASTPYVFFTDIDFVSSYRMHAVMKQHLKKIGNMDKIAIVIPAFEISNMTLTIPQNRSDMLKLLAKKKVRQFHEKVYFTGHAPTNYRKWKSVTKPYYVKFKDMYEPSLLLPTSVFSFDPRFVARFHNKASHSTQLHMAGFKFLVLHDCFVTHLPHQVNKQNYYELRKCSKQWYRNWVKEKRKQYKYEGKDVLDCFKG